MSAPGWGRVFRLGVGAKHVERDVNEELAFHIEMRARKLIAAGVAPDAAREQAMGQFGDLAVVRAECLDIGHRKERDVQRANHFHESLQDAGYALRALRHHAGFAAVVLLTLGIGIGANTAIFTLIDALLLRTLPVPRAEELVTIGDPTRINSVSTGGPRTDIFSYPLYADLRDRNRLVTGLFASGRTGRLDVFVDRPTTGAPTGGGGAEPEHPRGRLVSGNYFAVLGIRPVVGRAFTDAEDRVAGESPVVVISHAYWERRFAGDRGAVGRTISVNGTPLTIIGVAPAGFFGDIVGQAADIWIPLTMQPALMPHRAWLTDRNTSWLLLMGRRAPGVTLTQARGGFTTLVRQVLEEQGNTPAGAGLSTLSAKGPTVDVASGAKGFSRVRSIFGESLLTLMAAVGLVLLIACANVANLLLARAAARGKEIGVRMALGAGRARLVRQLLTESVVLAAAGGALGLAFATWGSTALLRLASGGPSPIPLDARLDWRVLGFAAALSLMTALLFGLAPALRATRVELASVLRAQSRGVSGGLGAAGGRRLGPGKLLVMLQVALSLLLLVGTSMLVRSMRRLERVDTGLTRDELLIVTVDAGSAGYGQERLAALSRDLLDRARRLPGVASATLSENGIFSGTESVTTLQIDGFTARTDDDTTANYDRVGPDYFRTIGARLLQGRDIRAGDDERAAKVAVVNATMAHFYWPDGSAVGRRVRIDSQTYDVVGVVADIRDHDLRDQPARRLYLSVFQTPDLPTQLTLELRAAGDPARLVVPARRALLAADASLLVTDDQPLTELMAQSVSRERLVSRVVTFFGALALALAALGLYGVMAYATLRRTSEFGLRMALGAEPRDVTRMVLGEAARLVAGGVLVGLPVALVATRLLRSQLFGVEAVDPPSIALALVVLGASAALAGYLPAARAARVGPLVALRAE
ncbi:MAG: ABC transporter permease [Gemmatimonadaceae bacterium]